MTPLPNAKINPIVWPLFAVLFALWWLSLSLYDWTGFGVGAALDLLLALGLWGSVFSGQPLLAFWAEHRKLFDRMHAQASPKFFDFLLVCTGRLGWLYLGRSAMAFFFLLSPRSRDWLAAHGMQFSSLCFTAGIVFFLGEYLALRKILSVASRLTRRSR